MNLNMLQSFRSCFIESIMEVEKYGPQSTVKHQKSKKHGNSIPMNVIGDRMYPILTETDGNLERSTVECGHQISPWNT